jgi:ABC-type sugar transport system ATPase subunit
VKPMLAAESISKSFGRHGVLTSARSSVSAGGITLLAGRNGSGKSTLLGDLCRQTRARSGNGAAG